MATNRSIPQDQGVVTHAAGQMPVEVPPEVLAGYFSQPPKVAASPAQHQVAQQFMAEFISEYARLLRAQTPTDIQTEIAYLKYELIPALKAKLLNAHRRLARAEKANSRETAPNR